MESPEYIQLPVFLSPRDILTFQDRAGGRRRRRCMDSVRRVASMSDGAPVATMTRAPLMEAAPPSPPGPRLQCLN
eukprot:3355036-Pyramimonas_sp.AAC.1